MLKDEINTAGSDILSFAKWKLVIVFAVAIIALGWKKDLGPSVNASSFLICSIGFVCAYVDWIIYKRYIVIHTIAHYLRNYSGNDPAILEMQRYELKMWDYRDKDLFFYSDRWPHFYSSMIISIGLPLLATFNEAIEFNRQFLLLAFFGVCCVVGLILKCNENRRSLLTRQEPVSRIENSDDID